MNTPIQTHKWAIQTHKWIYTTPEGVTHDIVPLWEYHGFVYTQIQGKPYRIFRAHIKQVPLTPTKDNEQRNDTSPNTKAGDAGNSDDSIGSPS